MKTLRSLFIFAIFVQCPYVLNVHAQTSAEISRMKAGYADTANKDQTPIANASRALIDRNGRVVVSTKTGNIVHASSTSGSAYSHTEIHAAPTANRTVTVPDASGTYELLNVVAKTTTGTLTAAECHGSLITNTGASGAIVLTLPTPAVGMRFRVYLTVAQDVDLNPVDGTQILTLTNATGDAISSAAAIGNAIELVAVSATQWVEFSASGTWTDVN